MKVAYKPYLRTQISLTFNIFYWILLCLDKLVKQALGQVEPDYHFKTSCPACHYRVSDPIHKPWSYCHF